MTEFMHEPEPPSELAATRPLYVPVGGEVEIFEAARRRGLPVMLKGPTGCGKTRLVEFIADRAGIPLFTVSCHEDMTHRICSGATCCGAARRCGSTARSRVRSAPGICYLDEIVEARQDATVAIHALTDHRRELYLERLGGERLRAADGSCSSSATTPAIRACSRI